MTVIQEIIRAAIPDADDAYCEYVLWARTPFPFVNLTAKDIYLAAYRLQRAANQNKRLCEFCDRIADKDQYTCTKCREALALNRERPK